MPAQSRATDDEKYSLEQLDRAHDIVTGMHPADRGALYRRAADAELTAEELFLDEEARFKAITGRMEMDSGPTLGTISAGPNIPENGPLGQDPPLRLDSLATSGGISAKPNVPEEEPAPRGNKRGKR